MSDSHKHQVATNRKVEFVLPVLEGNDRGEVWNVNILSNTGVQQTGLKAGVGGGHAPVVNQDRA